jgi:hypothetical protein
MSVDCEPSSSETVTTVMVPSQADKGSVHTFFKFQHSPNDNLKRLGTNLKRNLPVGNNLKERVVPTLPSLELSSLTRPLPPPTTAGLTRSQLLFSIGTDMDVRSLAVQGDVEFYLFMEMRAEFQWTSFTMTSQKWVSATHIYNERLEQQTRVRGILFIRKNPRALMEKLGEIEPKISKRLLTKNFKCLSFSSFLCDINNNKNLQSSSKQFRRFLEEALHGCACTDQIRRFRTGIPHGHWQHEH